MDPGTIAQIAQLAFSAADKAWQFYRFLKDANNINRTEEAFACEIDALREGCNAIGRVIKAQARPGQQDNGISISEDFAQLWRSLGSQLRSCNATVSQLTIAIFNSENQTTKELTFFSKVIRQVRLNERSKEIDQVRNQIRAHHFGLQMSLEAVKIHQSNLGPGKADQQLVRRLTRLKANKQKLEKLEAQHTLGKDETEILQLGTAVISSGETLCASSVGCPSVCGGQTSMSANYTQRWLKDMDAIENLQSATSSPGTGTLSPFFQHPHEQAPSANNALFAERFTIPGIGDPSQDNSSEEDCSDQETDDDEFMIEAAKQAVSTGRMFFQKTDYHAAKSTLQEALNMIRALPSKQELICDPCELRYMLAVCTYHVQSPSEALEALLSVVTNNPNARAQNNASRLRILEASHLLAMTYLRLGMVEQARISCEEALKGRRRLFRKKQASYYETMCYESIGLLGKIREAEGNDVQAQVLYSMIPEEARTTLLESFANLSIQPKRRESISTDASQSQTLCRSSVCENEPFQDTASLASKNVKLEYSPSIDTSSTHNRSVANVSLKSQNHLPRDSVANISLQSRDHLTGDFDTEYNEYFSEGLREVAMSMGYRKPQPTDVRTRRAWFAFLGLKPKKVKGLCGALLEGRKEAALLLINHWNLSELVPEDLHLAALFGEAEVVNKLLSIRFSAKAKWKKAGNLTPLHCAAMGGHYYIASRLIDSGCPINECSKEYGTPLSLAVLGERIDVIDLLQKRWQDTHLNATRMKLDSIWEGDCGKLGSVVHAASMTDNAVLLSNLIEDKRLLETARTVVPAHVRSLLHMQRTGTFLNGQQLARDGLLNPSNSRLEWIEGQPLAMASYLGCDTTAKYLISRPNVENDAMFKANSAPNCGIPTRSNRHTALTLASMSGAIATVQMLLKAGYNETQYCEDGAALFLAVLNGQQDCALLLLEHGFTVSSNTLAEAKRQNMLNFVNAHHTQERRRSAVLREGNPDITSTHQSVQARSNQVTLPIRSQQQSFQSNGSRPVYQPQRDVFARG